MTVTQDTWNDFVRAVAAHLTHDWKLDLPATDFPSRIDFVHSDRQQGFSLQLMGLGSRLWLHVQVKWPRDSRDNQYSPAGSEWWRGIQMDWGISTEMVARNIKCKLLPGYSSEYAKQKARVEQREAEYAEQLEIIQTLADLVGITPPKGKNKFGNDSMKILVASRQPDVDIELYTMDRTCAEAVLRAYIENQSKK
jgi:hypothetical protein